MRIPEKKSEFELDVIWGTNRILEKSEFEQDVV